jgi:5-methylcytosine-specific restriction endonuclease McrBC regulatory subunit McrC
LRDGTLTINRAIRWCKQPKAQQVEQFTQYTLERATSKVIRQSIARLKKDKPRPDLSTVLDALQQQEAR